jgi:hypothetical protein
VKQRTYISLEYDVDNQEYTASLRWCSPAPGFQIFDGYEGAPAESISEALRNLAEIVAAELEEAEPVIG